jgi:hypothetical protein
MLLAPAAVTGSAIGPGFAAGVAIAGFLILVSGLAAILNRWAGKTALAVAGAGLTGLLFASTFHLGDPFIEWSGAGRGSDFALTVLHAVNPLSGAVGNALDVDWLRLPIMYSGFPGSVGGGLSTAQYYYWHYFPWWGTALLHGVPGLLLLAGAGRRQGLRWRRHG